MSTADDQENEVQHTEYSAARQIPLAITVLISIVPIVILNVSTKRTARSRNGRITKWLMIGVIASNASYQIIFLMRWLVCEYCPWIIASWQCSRVIVKGFNLTFLLHRAGLAQGLTPVLSKKWFDLILPAVIVLGMTWFLVSVVLGEIQDGEYDCVEYHDWNSMDHCLPSAGLETFDDSLRTQAAIAIGLDAIITTFLLVLLVIPLSGVYKVNLAEMNVNQLRQRKKIQDMLIWSIAMTFVNQVSSTLTLAPVFSEDPSDFPFGVWLIGQCDPAINVWTAWLMVTRNRIYLQRLMPCKCCTREIEAPSSRRASFISKNGTFASVLGNIPSRPDTLKRNQSMSLEMVGANISVPV